MEIVNAINVLPPYTQSVSVLQHIFNVFELLSFCFGQKHSNAYTRN